MSASEKLKALYTQRVIPVYRKTDTVLAGADAFTRARDIEAVIDALPQIVAVVEAAERRKENEGPIYNTSLLDSALTALEEALDDLGAADHPALPARQTAAPRNTPINKGART